MSAVTDLAEWKRQRRDIDVPRIVTLPPLDLEPLPTAAENIDRILSEPLT